MHHNVNIKLNIIIIKLNINNLRGWKQPEKSRLDRESNPHLFDDQAQRSLHKANLKPTWE